jgi:protein SCO1
MQDVATTGAQSEPQFASLVDALAADPARREQLTELLREDHPVYDQRGTAATVRMRGWVLLALARVGVSDAALLFVLEELDTGMDAYLVAAAARALRSYPSPKSAFAPFVMRGLNNIRHHDEPVSFDNYGEYATSSMGTTAVHELLVTLAWLGPRARGVLPEVEALRAKGGGLSRKLLIDVDRAVEAIRADAQVNELDSNACCMLASGLSNAFSRALGSRRGCEPIDSTVFEDQEGASITFKEFFRGHPSIVVFFYTRCDNPLKCSLTVTKLARVQKLLEKLGLAEQIHTAAITYDPAFDLPERLRRYGQNRGVRMDPHHRMLRAVDGLNALRGHFELGVNFIESLVNRHRVETYILDAEGRVATSFERIHWDEQQVVDRTIGVLNEKGNEVVREISLDPTDGPAAHKIALPMLATLASVGVAFFPKCPICWATYLSVFGIAGLGQIPYLPWLQLVLVALMLINIASVWFRGRSTSRMSGFYLACAGALAIVLKIGLGWKHGAPVAVALTLAGSLLSALNAKSVRRAINTTEHFPQLRRKTWARNARVRISIAD